MRITYLLITLTCFATLTNKAQTLYSETFSTMSLTTGTNVNNGAVYAYGNLPNTMMSLNIGSFKADTLVANYPFKAPFQSAQAWLAYKPSTNLNVQDTFAVSTSWLLPVGTANAWMITPLINNITSGSVLTWEAMAPDASNADGYEVYISTTTNSIVSVSDFSSKLSTIISEQNNWTAHGLSLAAFAGQSIRIAFKNNSTDKYQLWLDDIVVKNISNQYDVMAVANNTYKYGLTNINQTIKATFKNNGYESINSAVLNYKVGNNNTISESLNFSTPINYSEERVMTASNPFISSIASYNNLKVWVSNINGQTDQLLANDTVISFITIQASSPAKKVLIEEFTSTACGFCPDAQDKLRDIANTNTNVVVASIHKDDFYGSNNFNALTSLANNNLEVALIDRYQFQNTNQLEVNKGSWSASIAERQSMTVPATVNVTSVAYNSSTGEINAIVSSNFISNVKGDYRLNLYVKENNVYSSNNSSWLFSQLSYYYNIPNSPYYQLGTYINNGSNPASYILSSDEFKQQYVVNDILGTPFGVSGIVSSNGLTAGQTYTASFSYTLPAVSNGMFRFNDFNTYLIATISEYQPDNKQRHVLNVSETKLTSSPESVVGINEQAANDLNVRLYPNPATDVVYLSYSTKETQPMSLSIYNTLGELVIQENIISNVGDTNRKIDISALVSGNYSLIMRTKKEQVAQKLIIIK